jgi:hypothetical protein
LSSKTLAKERFLLLLLTLSSISWLFCQAQVLQLRQSSSKPTSSFYMVSFVQFRRLFHRASLGYPGLTQSFRSIISRFRNQLISASTPSLWMWTLLTGQLTYRTSSIIFKSKSDVQWLRYQSPSSLQTRIHIFLMQRLLRQPHWWFHRQATASSRTPIFTHSRRTELMLLNPHGLHGTLLLLSGRWQQRRLQTLVFTKSQPPPQFLKLTQVLGNQGR